MVSFTTILTCPSCYFLQSACMRVRTVQYSPSPSCTLGSRIVLAVSTAEMKEGRGISTPNYSTSHNIIANCRRLMHKCTLFHPDIARAGLFLFVGSCLIQSGTRTRCTSQTAFIRLSYTHNLATYADQRSNTRYQISLRIQFHRINYCQLVNFDLSSFLQANCFYITHAIKQKNCYTTVSVVLKNLFLIQNTDVKMNKIRDKLDKFNITIFFTLFVEPASTSTLNPFYCTDIFRVYHVTHRTFVSTVLQGRSYGRAW